MSLNMTNETLSIPLVGKVEKLNGFCLKTLLATVLPYKIFPLPFQERTSLENIR